MAHFTSIRIILCLCLIFLTACSTQYPNQQLVGKQFPSITGQSLEQQELRIPEDFTGQNILFLIGYKQDSQFDIDRWLIGLDMTQTRIQAIELPTIQGMFPRMFKTQIDNGMRSGIPKELWKGVITVYRDGARVQEFTGNQNPNNARVVLLDGQGKIIYFYDRGFSVDALNDLRALVP
ncbi:MAG: hypothetical protein QNJ69_05570 [Gammaproteobacteria bacterium]|nr:hypothetical protein [Gammaproteobacteria bacterium]